MNKRTKVLQKYGVYLVAFIIPWVMLILRSLYAHSWVTGEGSLLRGDMSAQLVPFFYELWNKVHTGDVFSFTWNIGGGTDFGAISGYLFSPFTLLVLVFPKDWIPNVVQFIMVTKWALVSVSMVYFFIHTKHNTLKEHKQVVSLFLGIAYGMGTGMINYMGFIQFNDVMICFPFLLLLVEKLVEEDKWKLYYLVLTFAMMSNLYLTFSVCLFLLMWFFLQLETGTRQKGKKFFLFAGTSVLAACTCLSGLVGGLTLAQARLDTSSQTLLYYYLHSLLVEPYDFIKQLFALTPIAEMTSFDPNIYFSVIGAVLVGLFLFIKISKKKKIYMLFMTAILTISFFFGPISIVWHCFAVPNAANHRFSYLFVFMMVFLLLHVLIHLEELRLRHIYAVGAVDGIAFVVTFLLLDNFLSYLVYLVTALLIALTVILLHMYRKKSILYRQMLLTVTVIGILEMCMSAFVALGDYDRDLFFYEDGNLPVVELAEDVTVAEGERMEYMQCTLNMGLVTSKPSDSAFLSSINGYKQNLQRRLGMPYNGQVQYSYCGASPLVNLLSNIRYYITTDKYQVSDVEAIAKRNDYSVYQTKRLAGLGYMVDDAVLDWNLDAGTCFTVQNDFVEKAADGDPIFTMIKQPQLTCYNTAGEIIEADASWAEKGIYRYNHDAIYGDEMDTMIAEYVADEDIEDLYIYELANWGAYLTVFIGNELVHTSTESNTQQTLHMGEVKKGEHIVICAIPSLSGSTAEGGILVLEFAEFHEDAYAKVYEKLSKNVYQIETYQSDYIKGSIQAEKSGIMLTSVPALNGFEVYVDGNREDYESIAGAMIGVPLDEGEHTVEFKYQTPSSLVGKIVSVGAFVVYVILCLISYRKKRMDEVTDEVETE